MRACHSRASYHCAQAALPKLRDAGGTLILMTSPAGMEGSRMLPPTEW